MNETERAIAEIIGTNYGESQCHRETMVLAAAALREQAERSGCEYCKDMKYMPFAEHKVYIDGNGKLDVDSDEDFQLNFCPMCGRRLEVEP